MNTVLSHPTGNRNVREVLAALLRANMLVEFHTTIAADPDAKWLKLIPESMRKEWLRRNYAVPKEKLMSHPYFELARIILPKLGIRSAIRHEAGMASVDAVYKNLDKAVASRLEFLAKRKRVEAVYAYEDGALETFKQAKKWGIKCIYDLPIAYWETGRRLLQQEAERLPEWAITLGGGIGDSEAKLERKTQEMELADVVVSPGQFVMESIPEWARDKQMIVSPFGSPQTEVPSQYVSNVEKDLKRPLRVLFVGSMGQRKGLGDLFEAMRHFNPQDVELVVMGSLLAPMEFYKGILPDFKYEKGRPHDQVLVLMRTCDVFCLPSIVEGRALVMQEAMSQGLPLIITPNTGGEDLIKEGQTGFLVPNSSPESIAEKITWFLEHRLEIPQMGDFAQSHASQYTWEKYGANIVESLCGTSVKTG